MGEKRWFLIEWKSNGTPVLASHPCNDKEKVMAEYRALKDQRAFEVCETIYG
jgi:hypothetical protein